MEGQWDKNKLNGFGRCIDNYGNYYATINSKFVSVSNSGTCNTGYTKNMSLPSYAIYQETTLLNNKCIPLPASLQHLPLAGNGLPCGQNVK